MQMCYNIINMYRQYILCLAHQGNQLFQEVAMSKGNLPVHDRSGEKYLSAFLIGFLCIFISLLPVIIADGGYFIYYGDYNAQQIPFYILANNAVRSGQLGWNWFTDLGSDFLTSYSFYLAGSPFFWLSTILPKFAVTASMPFLLALKHGIASLTAYAYIRRFVRSKNAALAGGLLYAFSGFQVYNIFFNHFQDVTAFFPLMLIAMEENINNGRKGVFALTVALMSVINYFFFTGQAVFLVLYYILRMNCPDFRTSWKKFGGLVLEAILGTMIGAFMLLPSALAIIGNYRVNEHLFGQDMILYSDKTRIARIIQSFFMPVDVPARPNLFSSANAKWSSIGGYLPLFSMIGVITFMRERKKHWASRFIAVCTVCAFIPVLNSAFYALNSSYYARWYYMPILILAMMTAHTLDNADSDAVPGIKVCAGMLAAFAVISVLPSKDENGNVVFFKLPSDIGYFGLTLAVAAASLIAAAYIFRRKKKGLPFMRLAAALTSAASVVCLLTAVIYGANSPAYAKKYIAASFKGTDGVYENVSEDNFFRTDISKDCDNYPMSWGLPSMRAFQSVVSSSIMEFYDNVGVKRDVASRAELSHYTLRGLFSVKYYYDEKKDSDEDKADISAELPGFEKVSENDYFEIYENTLYIPMGFGYRKYISDKNAEAMSEADRERLLMDAVVLNDEQIEKYSDILTEEASVRSLSKADYMRLCSEKQENCSESFTYDSGGFTSEITLSQPQLVFFSVPYSDGWSCEVNGKKADVEKVSYGFMAVKADQGKNVITFSYRTPGLAAGTAISVTGAILLAAYVLFCRFSEKKNGKNNSHHTHYYDYTSVRRLKACGDYCSRIADK